MTHGYMFLPLDLPSDDSPDIHLPPFKYNPLHDLESLWWVAVYYVVGKNPVVPDDRDTAEVDAKRKLSAELFSTPTSRVRCILVNNAFARDVRCLHPSLRQSAKALQTARSTLVKTYRSVETDIPELDHIDWNAADRVYEEFIQQFSSIALALAAEDIEVYST